MSFKYFVFIFLLFAGLICHGQNSFLKVSLDNNQTGIIDSYLIKDDSSEVGYVLFKYEKELHLYKFNQNKQIEKHIISSTLKKKYIHIIGYALSQKSLTVILINKKANRYALVTYNFNSDSTSQSEHSFSFSKENFVQSFNTQSKCYLFTREHANLLNVYEFKPGGDYFKKQINLENLEERLKDFTSYFDLYELNPISKEMPKVNNTLPTNLTIASCRNKMYEFEKGFIWSFDKFDDHTLLMEFKYPEFIPKIKFIPKHQFSGRGVKTNSYVFDNKIAQLVSSPKKMTIEIKSLEGENEIIKIFRLLDNQDIDFKNTAIMEVENIDGRLETKTYEKTSKFLRKITDERTGLFFYRQDSSYVMVVGGIKYPTLSGTADMGYYNYEKPKNNTLSLNSNLYNSSQQTHIKTTKFKSIVNSDFKNIKGDIKKNSIEKLKRFKETYGNMSAESLFYMDGKLIFGFNSLGINEFEFLSFE